MSAERILPSSAADYIPDDALPAVRELLREVMPSKSNPDMAEIDKNNELARAFASKWLVKGEDVVRYHADTESEGKGSVGESIDEYETFEEYEAFSEKREAERYKRSIELRNDEFTARWQDCENCGMVFDVSVNFYDSYEWPCNWHPGMCSHRQPEYQRYGSLL